MFVGRSNTCIQAVLGIRNRSHKLQAESLDGNTELATECFYIEGLTCSWLIQLLISNEVQVTVFN